MKAWAPWVPGGILSAGLTILPALARLCLSDSVSILSTGPPDGWNRPTSAAQAPGNRGQAFPSWSSPIPRVSGPPWPPSARERPSRGDVDADLASGQRLQQHDAARACRTRRPRARGIGGAGPGGRGDAGRGAPLGPEPGHRPDADQGDSRGHLVGLAVLHRPPGPGGRRGPSSLDWAIMGGAARWGVTVLQANAEMNAGDIWASIEFTMPGESKSSAYRTEVADAAAEAVLLAVTRVHGRPVPARATGLRPNGRHGGLSAALPPIRPDDRLGGRNYRGGAAQAARRRLQPRRPGHDRRHRVLPVRRVPRRRAARPGPGRSWPGGTARSAGPPRTGRSGSRSCAASGTRRPGEDLQAARHPRALGAQLDGVPRSPPR